MSLAELFVVAAGLSMDAFAVGVCAGLTMRRATFKKAAVVGLYFGFFQAVMPLLGYFAGAFFAGSIAAFDHWAAFGLLCFLGGKMIAGSFKSGKCPDAEPSLRPSFMLPLAFATSIDALAAGVSFAFIHADIVQAALIIGAVTFLTSAAGVKIGKTAGARFASKAEFAGGLILVLIGTRILLEHLRGYA
ncbi:MAG: manganese efflux pump MntP family protein [Oscillospiraceae bacterium]|nr:manganese efflux pump MntP family protein [Oscillospiraceae bacterium]